MINYELTKQDKMVIKQRTESIRKNQDRDRMLAIALRFCDCETCFRGRSKSLCIFPESQRPRKECPEWRGFRAME